MDRSEQIYKFLERSHPKCNHNMFISGKKGKKMVGLGKKLYVELQFSNSSAQCAWLMDKRYI